MNDGGATTGNVWSFTTVEGAAKATGPSPADGATGVATTENLDWDDAVGATLYRIYLGTNQSNLPLVGTRVASDLNPAGDFDLDTTYYWRVDTDAGGGAITTGDVWSFTTENLEPVLPDIADMTNTVGDVVDITLPVASGGTLPYTYSISGLPQGLQFDETTRRITGTITG